MVKVECQLCGGLGHKASVCPSRTSTGRRLRSSEKVCQLCDQVGHDATACPAEGGGDEEDDDHADDPEDDDDEDDEDPDATKSQTGSCYLCCAGSREPCKDPACPSKEARDDRLHRLSKKGKTTSQLTALATVGGPSPDDILKLKPSQLAGLPLKHIYMLPEVYAPWIQAPRTGAEKVERHRQLFDTLRTTYFESRASSGEASKVSPYDTDRARRDLERLRDLLDPSSTATQRVQHIAQQLGYDMIAFRDASNVGWAAVRKAQEVFRAEAQVSRSWAQALAKGVSAAKAIQSAKSVSQGNKQNPKQRRKGGGGGGGRGSGGRGGQQRSGGAGGAASGAGGGGR